MTAGQMLRDCHLGVSLRAVPAWGLIPTSRSDPLQIISHLQIWDKLIKMCFYVCPGASPETLPPVVDHCSPNPCQNQAICRSRADGHSCFCVPGFQGANCQIDVNECVSQPCRNAGTCVDKVGRFSCLCPPGFTGEWGFMKKQCLKKLMFKFKESL